MNHTAVNSMLASLAPVEEVQPWNNRVLIRPIEAEETTASGLVVPKSARRERPIGQAQVIAVSPWLESEEPTDPKLIPGDRVYYDTGYESLEVEINGVRHFLVDIDAIAGVIRVRGGV